MMYACANVKTDYKVLPLSVGTPIWMRAPGEVTGAFALETAMDELAHQLKIDPLQLRLINFAEKHPENNLPWSSNYLKECYETGAKNFGWEKRNATPRATRQGDWLVGYGMATGTWSSWRAGATCRAVLSNDGNLLLQSAASDMGPGTATTMVKIAMEAIGIDKENIKFELGKSNLPDAPGQGGSLTVASVGSAVQDACDEIKAKLLAIAAEKEGSPFKDIKIEEVLFAEAKISLKSNNATQVTYNELLTQKNLTKIEVIASSKSGDEQGKYAFNTFGVHFAEVHVHALTGVTRVKRFLTCADAGKIINMKTASSQMSGAVVMGIGMALMEELRYDHRFGRAIGGDFANYHIPVQTDVPKIDVHFINKPDLYLNKMGSKGLGEIGLIGAAAAIGNAIFNATGKRLTDLPMTLDKLL
jgi:xanthine dehydrogenase YagR molybdenum-binding subunit